METRFSDDYYRNLSKEIEDVAVLEKCANDAINLHLDAIKLVRKIQHLTPQDHLRLSNANYHLALLSEKPLEGCRYNQLALEEFLLANEEKTPEFYAHIAHLYESMIKDLIELNNLLDAQIYLEKMELLVKESNQNPLYNELIMVVHELGYAYLRSKRTDKIELAEACFIRQENYYQQLIEPSHIHHFAMACLRTSINDISNADKPLEQIKQYQQGLAELERIVPAKRDDKSARLASLIYWNLADTYAGIDVNEQLKAMKESIVRGNQIKTPNLKDIAYLYEAISKLMEKTEYDRESLMFFKNALDHNPAFANFAKQKNGELLKKLPLLLAKVEFEDKIQTLQTRLDVIESRLKIKRKSVSISENPSSFFEQSKIDRKDAVDGALQLKQ